MPDKKRVWEIDFLRGFAIIAMIFDHIMVDFSYFFVGSSAFASGVFVKISDFANIYMESLFRDVFHNVFVIIFLTISGISCSFSRNNLLRGVKLLAVALLLSLVTYLLDYFSGSSGDYFIAFGILHLLSISIILYALIRRFGNLAVILTGSIIIAAGIALSILHSSNPSNHILMWLTNPGTNILAPFGIYILGFYSADYFPILPWTGVFLLGTYLGKALYSERVSLLKFEPKLQRPFAFVGRHALLVYIVHQPIIYGIIWLIAYVAVR